MTKYRGKVSKGFATSMLLTLLFVFACSEKKLGPEDVEYRKDENGTLILYEIDAEMPYGNDQEAFVIGKHPNGKKHFQISFVNGLKDGPFSFWKDNGCSKLQDANRKKGWTLCYMGRLEN